MTKLFGTDGIRARAGQWPLTPEFTTRLGQAIGHTVRQHGKTPSVVIGRDTRRSGAMLESALAAGLLAQGLDVTLLGEISTPGVSHLTTHMGAGMGIVVSASHNPHWDNGIKLFDGSGAKASEAFETLVEELAQIVEPAWDGHVSPGTLCVAPELGQLYVDHLVRTFGPEGSLGGLRVVLDCANGAVSRLAPQVFRRLGADVIAINVEPDGSNINVDCGTEGDGPQRAGRVVVREGADVGFIFDGDADRCKFVDESGRERDGDFILAILARWLQAEGRLAGNGVVATEVSNVGLDQSLIEIGVTLERTQVGDRWVAERMRQRGFVLGGEPTGHILLFENGLATGDGLYTALRMSRLLLRNRPKTFSELSRCMNPVPQVREKAAVTAKPLLESLPGVQAQLQRTRQALGPDVAILLRYSGTEPVVRVMLQGPGQSEEVLHRHAMAILHAVVADVDDSR